MFFNDLRPPTLLGIFDRFILKIVGTAKQVSPHRGRTHKSELHEAFKTSYVYDMITKSSRQQAEVHEIIRISMLTSLNTENPNTEYITDCGYQLCYFKMSELHTAKAD